jgi:hypothetical protein
MLRHFPTISCLTIATALTCQAVEWALPPVIGESATGWGAAPNWFDRLGNPMSDTGATWGLYYQTDHDGPTALMQFKTFYGQYTWSPNQDDYCNYRGRLLESPAMKPGDFPGHGPAAMVVFTPPGHGAYLLTLDGTATASIPDAGDAGVRILVIGATRAEVNELRAMHLNGPVAITDLPVALSAGQSLALEIRANAPGPATCGQGKLTITSLTMKPAK